MKHHRFLHKRMNNTKPSHDPIHFRVPAKILWRAIRGSVYERLPPPYEKVKRKVIPDALNVPRLQAWHKYCLLGRLSSEVGWNYYDTIKVFESMRKERAELVIEKKQLTKLKLKA